MPRHFPGTVERVPLFSIRFSPALARAVQEMSTWKGHWSYIPVSVALQLEQRGDALGLLIFPDCLYNSPSLSLVQLLHWGQFPVNRFGVAWTQSTARLCHTFRSKSARSPASGVFCTVWSHSLLSHSIWLITNVVGSQHREALPSAELPWDACPLLLEISGYFYQSITFFYDVMLRATRVSQ